MQLDGEGTSSNSHCVMADKAPRLHHVTRRANSQILIGSPPLRSPDLHPPSQNDLRPQESPLHDMNCCEE
eukprot:2695309-Amphidinium_carterae.1